MFVKFEPKVDLLVDNGDGIQPYIGEDAAAGLIALYGLLKDAKGDVSVSHWRYGGKVDGGVGGFFSAIIGWTKALK